MFRQYCFVTKYLYLYLSVTVLFMFRQIMALPYLQHWKAISYSVSTLKLALSSTPLYFMGLSFNLHDLFNLSTANEYDITMAHINTIQIEDIIV